MFGLNCPVLLSLNSTLVRPQVATQYAIGYFRNFKEDMYETSVEIYYKDLRNQVELKESRTVKLRQYKELDLIFGVA